ncbi:hypothetical protein Tco_1107128 [Tanacetum coccineum]
MATSPGGGLAVPDISGDRSAYQGAALSSSSSEFSPTHPPIVTDKGKGKIIETYEDDQLNQLMPFMDEGGSAPKLSNLQQFSTSGEVQMTIEDAKAQMEEIKRLAALKLEKEKIEKRLKKVMHLTKLKLSQKGWLLMRLRGQR